MSYIIYQLCKEKSLPVSVLLMLNFTTSRSRHNMALASRNKSKKWSQNYALCHVTSFSSENWHMLTLTYTVLIWIKWHYMIQKETEPSHLAMCAMCQILASCSRPLQKVYQTRNKMKGKDSFNFTNHYGNVIMGAIASQVTSLTIVYTTARLFRRRRKKTSKLRVTGLCEFPAQMASNAENVSIW